MAEHTKPRPPSDAEQRQRALDPAGSFIVQAPAGSGKTALLIQRLLTLLAGVQRPEEIVAITFTRKAAGEMQARLMEAVHKAANEAEPSAEPPPPGEESHEQALLRRARTVLDRDRELGWGLRENPARLRILTFDAFCAQLVHAAPVMSGLGGHPGITDDRDRLYQEAAQQALAGLEEGGAVGGALGRLLLHLDNDLGRCERLLVTLLARRDQWLRHLAIDQPPERWREALEAELRAVVTERMAATRTSLESLLESLPGGEALAALREEAAYAAANVVHEAPESAIAVLSELSGGGSGLPPTEPESLPLWRGLAELLLTNAGTWRKSVTKNQGFPAGEQVHKPRMQDVLAGLGGSGDAGERVASLLHAVRGLPAGGYRDAQWAVMEALLVVLPHAVGHLERVFAREGGADYVAVAQAAQRVLDASPAGTARGDEGGNPIAEGMPRHVLVDEFQDTSRTQYEMLLHLTRHWPDDGSHTLFLVGDPMQSIYRFREAEVGLFQRARAEGLGTVKLEALILTENFRSRPSLVAWVNATFPDIMSEVEDAETGAVPFASSTAHRDEGVPSPVIVHPEIGHGAGSGEEETPIGVEETNAIVAMITEHLRDPDSGSLAVLVRARTHLAAIVPALQEAGHPFRAVEIDALTDRQITLDLLSLTRALVNRADRIAWLAVLRAPWCGLSLEDLHSLCGGAPKAPVWARLTDPAVVSMLTPEGAQRAGRLVAVLEPVLRERGRRPLRRWVEGAWLGLGGPACASPVEADHADRFFELLEGLAPEPIPDPAAVERGLERLFAAPDPASDGRVQIMSIHKSKGLEFDTVILPGLAKRSRGDDNPLLRWFERPIPSAGGGGLLLAPIQGAGEDPDPVYTLLSDLEKARAAHELGRLLYVAATRAKERLHLLGHVNLADDGLRAPSKGTLLGVLWPHVAEDFQAALDAHTPASPSGSTDSPPPLREPPLRRLPLAWVRPEAPPGLEAAAQPGEVEREEDPARRVFEWASETARHVGTVTHALLCRLAESGRPPDDGAFLPPDGLIEAALTREGVVPAELAQAVGRVKQAVGNTMADERGRWILTPHTEARSEYAVTAVLNGEPRHLILDRTFVDGEGVRWIIDYKVGHHAGGNLEGYLDEERERYRDQLERYAEVMARLDPERPIRLGLYFPLHTGWRAWTPGE